MKTMARDRTVSPRKRAGSRRNKKQKNVKTFKSDLVKTRWMISKISFYRLSEFDGSCDLDG